MRRYDVVTFDCYGTLIDWESGIYGAFRDAAHNDGVTLERAEVLRAYAEHEPAVEAPPFRAYRDVLGETARRVAAALGWNARDTSFLAESLPSWQPFPDTNAALERLRRAGHGLGILSNVDDDLIAETRKHFTVGFDLVITAQQVRSYKPGHAHFLAARKAIGDARWLHAAESNYHDVVPANELGVDNAWINRRGAARLAGGVPVVGEFRDLAGLAEAIA
jgi:2-haloalkanoic acid dehalogenase type II